MNQHVHTTVQFVKAKLLIHSLSVRVVPYNVCPLYALMATCLSVLQISAIAILAGGLYVLTHLFNIQSGAVYAALQRYEENKWVLIMAAFLLGNIAQSALTSSSAFEVFLGEDLVWSGIAAGRPPSVDELVAAFGRRGVQSLLTTNSGNF
eukprot:GHVS01084353.1.p2 GENE.GHVS01084353.1~~GHVS01084353.1.p2  ORF type:complete len:150 (-),score=35.33 GHVS01084353.1:327-776(-)